MNSSKSMLNACTWTMAFGISALVNVMGVAAEQSNLGKDSYAAIHFLNDKNEEKCTLPIPETSQIFDFSRSNQPCENNMVSTFWLENVPSATLIQFFENEPCSNGQTPSNFYFLLKTVKQPTDWEPHGGVTMSIDALRHLRPGELIAGKNLRVDLSPPGAFVGGDLAGKNLNERLSCVYIERSQPAN